MNKNLKLKEYIKIKFSVFVKDWWRILLNFTENISDTLLLLERTANSAQQKAVQTDFTIKYMNNPDVYL